MTQNSLFVDVGSMAERGGSICITDVYFFTDPMMFGSDSLSLEIPSTGDMS